MRIELDDWEVEFIRDSIEREYEIADKENFTGDKDYNDWLESMSKLYKKLTGEVLVM